MRLLQTQVPKRNHRLSGRTGFTHMVIEPELSAPLWPSARQRYSHRSQDRGDDCLREIVEACAGNVVALDESATVLHVSSSWRSFAAANGVSAYDRSFGLGSLRSCTTRACFTGSKRRGFLDDIRAMIRAERIESEEEYTFESPQGLRWFVAKAGQLRNLSGAGGRLLVTLEDITRRRIAEEELRNISGRLIHAREEERSREARDLHDDLSQRLAVLSIELAQLHRNIPEQHTELRSTVRSVLDRTREMASDIHRLSYQLHPFKLDHLGLSAALKSLCDEFSSHHEVRIKFQQEGSAETLQPDITLCLFRIVQEALSNIAKHSGARRAKVVLTTTDEAVRLRVFDRGCGFDAESPKVRQTLGLTSMKERLRLVGGELSIQSRPAKGTGIDAVVPLKRGTKH